MDSDRLGGDLAPKDAIQLFGVSRLALPDADASPSELPKLRRASRVSLDVPLEFGGPVSDVRSRRRRPAAIMPVPKAAVNEQRGPPPRKHQVRRAGQVSSVQSEAESERMGRLADRQLGLRVLRLYPGHRPGADGRVALPGPGRCRRTTLGRLCRRRFRMRTLGCFSIDRHRPSSTGSGRRFRGLGFGAERLGSVAAAQIARSISNLT